ncbi:5781_t:CDS:10 [Diversispora eburnea]|uniref:5781_t:CDS:1 n=1 Tax=Diversispora eburnea TaxID=1213867 RepID=A0A9N9G1J0_9GLOM|nr:5781_t:CDS:10 [Diversispora eburnea]
MTSSQDTKNLDVNNSNDSLQRHEHQLGGHDKLLSLDNFILVKPCNKFEKDFYESSVIHPKFAKWMPKYFGCLTLQGHNSTLSDQTIDVNIIRRGIEEQNANITGAVCIENCLYKFKKPCFLDLKLGKRLYGEDADEAKKQKMIRKAKNTTADSFAFKLTAFKVFKKSTDSYVNYSRDYCNKLNSDNLASSFFHFFEADISEKLRQTIIKRFIEDIESLIEVMNNEEMRLYGASLFVIVELATQLGISAGVSIYCLLQFEWNRRLKSMQYLYIPRTKLPINPSPPIPPGLFSWIKATIFLPDEFYLKNVGLDATIYIRFLWMAFQFLVFNTIIVGSILLPINYYGGGNETGVTIFSMNNIPIEVTEPLWAHAICTYFVSISWMYLLYKNYYDYMKMFEQHLLNRVVNDPITARTVMISRIPHNLRSEEKLQKFVENLSLGPVESARMVRHTGKLDRKIDRREKVLLELEKAHIRLAKNVCNAIDKRKFGSKFFAKLFGHKNDSFVILESGETSEHQRIQTLIEWLDPLSCTFPGDDTIEQEDSYGRKFIIWNSLSQISKKIIDKYQPTHRVKFTKSVRSIDHFLKKFNYLDRRIAELRSMPITEAPYKATSTGFVTFRDHISAQLCAQSIMCSEPHTCTTNMAPEPRDLLWDNLTMRFKEKVIRKIIVNACVWGLTIFWLFPIISILTLTSIDSLSKGLKFLGPLLTTSPLLLTLLQNVLPTVLVSTCMAILPWILMELSKQESFSSYSGLEEAVLVRYYHFSFFNVFIVFLFGITFLQAIFDVINKPTSILDVLATSLPRGATFFINYVIFNIITHGLELVQVGSQLFFHIALTSRFIATTPRMLQRITHPWSFQFYYYYPMHILVFVITLTYSTINPLILVFSLVYYSIALVVFKHQFAYCYVRRYEAGGKFYHRVFGYTTDGLIVFQLTILGMIWLRKAVFSGATLIPLLAGTIYFKYYCHKTFHSRTHFLALDSRDKIPNAGQDDQEDNQEQVGKVGKVEKINTDNSESSGKAMKSDKKFNDVHEETNSSNGIKETVIENRFEGKITDDKFYKLGSDNEINMENNLKKNYSYYSENTEKIGNSEESLTVFGRSDKKQLINIGEINENTQSSIDITQTNTLDEKKESDIANKSSFNNDGKKLKIEIDTNIPLVLTPDRLSIQDTGARRLTSRGNLQGCIIHPAHFIHDPNRKIVQDNVSPYQTYTHPNLVKSLNRKLWLPRDPLKKINVDGTVELDRALTSSEGGSGIVGYWGGVSSYLGEARVSMHGAHEFPISPFHQRYGTNHKRKPTSETGPAEQCDEEEISPYDCGLLSPEEEGIVTLNGFNSGELKSVVILTSYEHIL